MNYADAEHTTDRLAADDRPRTAIRNGFSEAEYDEAVTDWHVYDARTGEWF